MPTTTRSNNLDLVRWMKGGHKPTAKLMSDFTNESYVSEMATGQRPIGDVCAKNIERAVGLPPGWLDRDNERVLTMNSADYQLFQLASGLSKTSKEAVVNFFVNYVPPVDKP
jgi:hypothetical protein